MMDPLFASENAHVSEALRFAGIEVTGIDELVNTSRRYPAAIPVLSKLLTEVQHPRIKEGIARALSVKEARPFVKELIAEFRRMNALTLDEQHAKWAVANAISVAADDTDVPEIIEIMMDPDHGWTRFMLPRALVHARNNKAAAITALLRGLNDDDIIPEAAVALAKLRSEEAVEPLRRLSQHDNVDIRKAAAKALKRLESAK